MGGDADVQWNALLGEYRSRILFAELPADFDGDWHENPAPQWIICLSGRWWVETMDFFRTEMGPGDVMFGRDQGSHKGRGHRSGVVGSEPARLMIVQLDHVPDRVADAD